MKKLLLLAAVAIFGLPLAPAQAYVVDQNNSVNINTALNVTSSVEWQQEVRVGVNGELVGFQLYCMRAGTVRVSVYRGRGWHSGAADATLDVTVPTANALYAFALENFHLLFNTGDYFTISLSGPNGYTQFGASTNTPYPYGDIYVNGNKFSPYSLSFATFMNVAETPSLIVNQISDTVNPYDGKTSLREALTYARSLSGVQTITFDPSLAGQTVTLNSGWNNASDESALRVSTQITLRGLASFPGVTVAMAQGVQKRHIYVEASGSLNVSSLTFTGGYGDYGGSIGSAGTLAIRGCTFTGNHATQDGGAVHEGAGAPSLLIENSTFSGNSSDNYSSAIATGAQQTTYRYLTVTNNSGGGGALLLYQYPATMVNSLVASNSPDGVIALLNSSFSAQSTNNLLGPGNSGGLTNGANGNLLGVPANQLRLDVLGYRGGPTATVALLPGSPAVDAGVAIAGITADQRGFDRSLGAGVDIGAFELFPTQFADSPIIHPVGGTYENSVQISIATPSTGAIVRYTLDGSDPSSDNGQLYTGPFTLNAAATVQAIAYGRGWLDSSVASVSYTVLAPLPYWRILQDLASSGSQDLANPSGDGITNLLKYAFNLAPNPGDLLKANYQILTLNGTAGLPFITRDTQGRLVIEFIRRKASSNPGITYTVETGTDLGGWNGLDLSNVSVVSLDSIWERVTVTDPTVSTNRFGRVRVSY